MNACMHTRTQTHTHVCVHTCTFQSCTFQSIQPPNQTTFYPRSWPKWWSGYSSISMMDEWGYLEIAELIRKIDLREPAKELRVRAMSGYGRVHDDNSPVSRGIINGKNLQYCNSGIATIVWTILQQFRILAHNFVSVPISHFIEIFAGLNLSLSKIHGHCRQLLQLKSHLFSMLLLGCVCRSENA